MAATVSASRSDARRPYSANAPDTDRVPANEGERRPCCRRRWLTPALRRGAWGCRGAHPPGARPMQRCSEIKRSRPATIASQPRRVAHGFDRRRAGPRRQDQHLSSAGAVGMWATRAKRECASTLNDAQRCPRDVGKRSLLLHIPASPQAMARSLIEATSLDVRASWYCSAQSSEASQSTARASAQGKAPPWWRSAWCWAQAVRSEPWSAAPPARAAPRPASRACDPAHP